jgi:L-alanine-DL-glutamate epimerase-like enolase superfamily enzyme
MLGLMKITGYRVVPTVLDWGRRTGDINGVMPGDETPSSVLLLETDSDLTGVAVGQGNLIDAVFPAVEGEDPRSVSALYDRMLAWSFKAGHAGSVFGAIGTIDLALWDLKAKAAGEPLWRLLGGRDRAVPGYASGLDAGLDDDQLHALYTSFAEAGFIGAKLKGGRNVEDDLRRLAVVRDALGVDHPVLALDANESWNPTSRRCATWPRSSSASTWPGWRSRCDGGTPRGWQPCPGKSARRSPPGRTSPASSSTSR